MAGKFLIVDPDPQVCQVIVAVAKAAKITPVVCATLAEARTALAQHAPDLALVGDHLADGPGTAMLAVLAERCPDTETVMMVSGDQPELVAEAMRDGAADFLPRPFTAKQLALVLSRVMKNKAKRRNPSEPVGPCSALILDDEPLTLRVLGNFLAEVGFSVIQASSLQEARASLEQRVPDVLVSDIFLEADAALDFLRELKHRWPYLPVIVVSGSAQNSILLEALRAEAYSVLIKPLDKGEFQRVVQGARRLKSALEERSRLQRTIDARDSGLAFLQEMMARAPQPAPVAAPPPAPPPPPPAPPQDPPSYGGRAGATFDSLPSGIVLLDRDRKIVDLNPATCRLLHVQRDAMIGQLLENVRELEPFQAALLQTLSTGQTFTNLEATLALGTTRRTFGYNTAQLLGTQHEGAALIYFQDITAKKKVESHMRATERLASVGLLAAGVTNEISTPLTVAMGHSEMLLRYAAEPDRVARHVEKIQEALRHASEFTTKLMRLVKQPEESAKPTDLNQALNEAVHLVDRKLRLRSQQLETAFDAIAAEIIGDPIELQQVFLNLLSAASDRTPGGGTLKLVTSNLTGVVEIAIQDCGLGLPQSDESLNATAELDRPMGSPVLGLAISRNIVSRFGGVIRSEVEPGRGTTVTVRFPMVSATLRKQWVVNQSSRVRQLEPRGRSAVVLADPGGEAMAVKQWLEEGGQPVELRSSAETALAPLASGPPAVYVVDGAMHSPDWLTFLRAVGELRVAPVVLLLRDEAQRAIIAGLAEAAPTRLVSRPLTSEAVLQAVALAELDNIDGEEDEGISAARR